MLFHWNIQVRLLYIKKNILSQNHHKSFQPLLSFTKRLTFLSLLPVKIFDQLLPTKMISIVIISTLLAVANAGNIAVAPAPVVYSAPAVVRTVPVVHSVPVVRTVTPVVAAPVVRAVPVVHAAPIVRTVPVVHTAPVVKTVVPAPVIRTYAPAPVIRTYAPAPVIRTTHIVPATPVVHAAPVVHPVAYSTSTFHRAPAAKVFAAPAVVKTHSVLL